MSVPYETQVRRLRQADEGKKFRTSGFVNRSYAKGLLEKLRAQTYCPRGMCRSKCNVEDLCNSDGYNEAAGSETVK